MTTIAVHVLNRTEPKGLDFSVATLTQIQSGYKFRDQNGVERVALDFTMTNDFSTCPLKFMEAYVKGITLKRQRSSLNFGAAVHKALAFWYRQHDAEPALRIWNDFEDAEGDDLKTKQNGIALTRAYTARYPGEGWEILDIETPIVFEFGPDMYHFVIPDMVVRDSGRIYGVEHKHTKSIHRNYFRQFKPNQQLDGQVAGIRAKYGMCDGIIINPIEIQKGGRLGRPSPYFGFGPRDISTRTDEEIEWWRRDMMQIYKEISETVKGGYFRAVKSACNNFEGCGFRELHINLGDSYIQSEYYQPRTWNPMDRLLEGEASGE